ncbi:MAG: hypothetical protein ACQETF_09565 [Bacteroidota bacterium]
MHIQKLKNLVLFSLLLSLFTPVYLSAQSEDEKNAEDDAIILSPATYRQAYQSASSGGYSSQTGLIIGNGVFGVESNYRQPGARADLGFSISSYYDADDSAMQDGNLLIGALSIGRKIPITDYKNSAGRKKLEVYFRISPGFGVAGNSQFFPGVTATTEFGLLYHFTERVSLFTNAGGRYYWFPGLDEVGLLSRPAVLVGLQVNFTGGLGLVRF